MQIHRSLLILLTSARIISFIRRNTQVFLHKATTVEHPTLT